MKKRKLSSLILIGSLIMLVAVCGTVFAYMFRQTEYEDNQFTPAEVSCEVHEVTNADVTEKSGIKIENTGNINAYLRIRFVSYWVQITGDGSAEIVAKASTMPQFTLAAGWLEGSNDTYYYQSPVAPGEMTGEMLSSTMILTEEDGWLQVVEVFAEAIQSKPETSVVSSWNVDLDANGNIIKAP